METELKSIHFVKQGFIINKESKSSDTLIYDILLSMAKNYSKNLSEETRKGLTEKARQGHYPGNLKRGYKTVGDQGRRVWVIDKDKPDATFITRAFHLYESGNHSVKTVAQELFNAGWSTKGNPISIGELHKLLKDPFYCGEFDWAGKRYEGKHEPLVSKDIFWSVQAQLSRRTTGKYRKHFFAFGGQLLSCSGCGRAVTGEIQRGNKYYHCTGHGGKCSQKKYVREEDISKQIADSLNSLRIENPKLANWILKALKESHQDEIRYHQEVTTDLDQQHTALQNRLHFLYDEMVDKKISRQFYEQKLEQYEKQIEDVLEAKEKHVRADIDCLRLGANIFELSQRGSELYEKRMNLDEKRQVLNLVFSSIKLNGKKLDLTFHNGFEVVAKHAKNGNWLPD